MPYVCCSALLGSVRHCVFIITRAGPGSTLLSAYPAEHQATAEDKSNMAFFNCASLSLG